MIHVSALRRSLAGNNLDALCHALDAVILVVVDRLDRSPTAFLILRCIRDMGETILNIGALVLVCHQNTVMGCRDDHIFRAHHNHRNSQYIDRMAVLTGIIPCHITDAVLRHLLGQCVPCTQILPQIRIFDRHDALPVL